MGTPADAPITRGRGAQRRQALLDEREFLLRSLRDLDSELQAGDIEQADYEALRSRYTAQAAAVLRALDALDAGPAGGEASGAGPAGGEASGAGPAGGEASDADPAVGRISAADPARATAGAGDAAHATSPDEPRSDGGAGPVRSHRRRRRRILVGGAVVCFAAAATVLVVSKLGTKLPGQPVTGSLTLTKAQQEQRLLAQAETALVESKPAVALVAYRQVLALDPSQPEALSESGWLEFAAGVRAHDKALIRLGQAAETKAVGEHPGAFAPRFYLGAMLAQEGDTSSAVAQFSAGLGDHPPTTTLEVFASTIAKVYGKANIPVPAQVSAAAHAASGSASPTGSAGSGSAAHAGAGSSAAGSG